MGALAGMDGFLGWLQVAEHELLLFSAFWFVVGALDETVVDIGWLYLRLVGKARTHRLPADLPRDNA